MFVFGTQYLRGASPERDLWERDLYNIREKGFNTVRAWLTWNAIERSEGSFDYDYISTFLELAKKNDLQVGLLFHLHAAPEWAIRKYPQYFYVDENGHSFRPAVRSNTPCGGWPGLCFDHEEVREIERRFIEGVIKETKKHDCVSFYEPMNEPHQWTRYNADDGKHFCYCDASVKKFQEWLMKKYGDIKNLNDSWGHFYNDFDEVFPPRWFPSYSDYADFRLFTMDNICDEIAYRSEIIRSCDTKPVIGHAYGGGSVTCQNLGGMAFDDWKNAKVFDKWGYSAFPRESSGCAALGLGCDATRCAADGKEYWQSELIGGTIGEGLDIYGRVDVNTFNKFCVESIRHGASGLLFWQYRSEIFGNEFGGYSLTDYNGDSTELLESASKLCKALCSNEEFFCDGTQQSADVAIVFSVRSYLADWASSWQWKNKFAIDSMSGYYKMFWEENIPVDIVHEEFSGDISKYKMIILPSPYAISEELSEKLKKYVENGGVLISEPFYGAFRESFKRSYRIPGHGMDKVFGCHATDMRQRKSVVLGDGENKYEVCGTKQLELLINDGARVLYTTEDGYLGIVLNNYGKGRAIMCATNLGLSYSDRSLLGEDTISTDSANNTEFSKKLVIDVALELGVKPNVCTASGVKVSVIHSGKRDAVAVVLINSTGSDKKGTVSLGKAYASAKTVFGNAKGNAAKEGLDFEMPQTNHQ